MFVTVSQIFKPGGFNNTAGTPNFLMSIDQYVTNVQWTDSQIGGLQDATFTMRNKYTNLTNMVGGNWIVFGAMGGTLHQSYAAGAGTILVDGALDMAGNPEFKVGDPIIVSDGANSDIFKISALTYLGNQAQITLGAAAGQTTTTLLNAYAAGAKVCRLQFQALLTSRKHTTQLSNVFQLNAMGMMWRYQKVLGNFDITQQDTGASLYKIAYQFSTQIPEIIVNAVNFTNPTNIIYTGNQQNQPLASIINDILKTESGGAVPSQPNEATYWAFWIDAFRQACHQQVKTQNYASATYSIDIQGASVNMVTDSDSLASWSRSANMALANGGPGSVADFEYTGTGALLSSNAVATSQLFNIYAGRQYRPSWFVDWSKVTQGTPDLEVLDVDGNVIQDNSYGITAGAAAGRFTPGSPIWIPQNQAPNSDSLVGYQSQGTWVVGAGVISATGTGAAFAGQIWYSPNIPVAPNTNVTFSLLVDPSHITAGSMNIKVLVPGTFANIGAATSISAGSKQRYSITVNVGNNSQVVIAAGTGGCTVASGQLLTCSHPMFVTDNVTRSWYISSERPQVQMQALMWTGANIIATSGQKVKFSQPMFTLDGAQDPNVYVPFRMNLNGDVADALEVTDMDITNLMNAVLVQGGKDGNGNDVSIIVTHKPSYTQWGYYEGQLSNPNITDKTALATWAAGQMGVLAWPRNTSRFKLMVNSLRMTARDLLNITGFDDGSTLITNPVEIRHEVDMKKMAAAATITLSQQQPNFNSIMKEIANERSIRQRQIGSTANLADASVVSGCKVSTSGLNWSVTAGVVQFNNQTYNIPAKSGTMTDGSILQLGVQISGTPPGGYTVPGVCPMPSFQALSTLFANEFFQLEDPGGGAPLNLIQKTSFTGVFLARLTAINGQIQTANTQMQPFGGVGTWNLKPPTAGTPTVSSPSQTITAEGVSSARVQMSFTLGGVTFDDTIDSVQIVRAIAGSNNWGMPIDAAFAPTSGAISFVDHGLDAAQNYDYGVIVRGHNGQALNATPILIGTSPTITGAAIANALAPHSIGWKHFIGDTSGDSSTSLVDGSLKRFLHGSMSTGLQAAIDASSNLLTTAVPGSLSLIASGTYAGWYSMLVSGVKDTNGYSLPTNVMTWQEWVAVWPPGGTGYGYGPIFYGDDANSWFRANFFNGGGGLFWSTDDVGGSTSTGWMYNGAGSENNGKPHTFRMGIAYVSGTNPSAVWRIVVYIDGTKIYDNNVTGNFIGSCHAGFAADSAGAVYIKSFRHWVGSGDVSDSTGLAANVPNSTSYLTNAAIFVKWPSASTTATIYIDDGSGNGVSPTFQRPDKSSFTGPAIGHFNPTQSGGYTVSGLSTSSSLYICAYYLPGDTSGVGGTGWHILTQQTPFKILDTAIVQAYQDGGYFAYLATTNASSSGFANGTNGKVTSGSGGGGRMLN